MLTTNYIDQTTAFKAAMKWRTYRCIKDNIKPKNKNWTYYCIIESSYVFDIKFSL